MATATAQPGTHTPFHLPRPVASAADHVIRTFGLWRRRARERAELTRWEDRDLRDAGLSRDVLHNELAKPFWRG